MLRGDTVLHIIVLQAQAERRQRRLRPWLDSHITSPPALKMELKMETSHAPQ